MARGGFNNASLGNGSRDRLGAQRKWGVPPLAAVAPGLCCWPGDTGAGCWTGDRAGGAGGTTGDSQESTERCWRMWGARCCWHPPPKGVAEDPGWLQCPCSLAVSVWFLHLGWVGVPCLGVSTAPCPPCRVLLLQPLRAPVLNNSVHRSACAVLASGHRLATPASPDSCWDWPVPVPVPGLGPQGPEELPMAEQGAPAPCPAKPDAGQAAPGSAMANELFAREAR